MAVTFHTEEIEKVLCKFLFEYFHCWHPTQFISLCVFLFYPARTHYDFETISIFQKQNRNNLHQVNMSV